MITKIFKMIQITANNKTYQFTEKTSLEELLEKMQIDSNGIAIAINQEIVPKADWQNTYLNNNDDVLIITATQGG